VLGAGARWHRRQEQRSAFGVAALVASATLGVVVMLNLAAGPSILDRVLPPGALHEPRERDYFFALGFATAGLWIGAGAVVVARRWLNSRPLLVAPLALSLAGLPIALNWKAATRRPDGMLAPTFGEALLASAPPRAMLLLAGDNDSYTVWYRQAVLGERRDVVPITIPLLAAGWYRAEQQRRYRLLDSGVVQEWQGDRRTLSALVAGAQREGRPVAAALSVSVVTRRALAPVWTLGGMVYVAGQDSLAAQDHVDSMATRRVADLIQTRLGVPAAGRDPASAYVARLLHCPSAVLQLGIGTANGAEVSSLDSRCNFK